MPPNIRQGFLHLLPFSSVILLLLIVCIATTQATNCEDTSIGVEAKGIIPDSSFTASSHINDKYQPYFARLLNKKYGWQPENPQSDDTQYLQIDLGFEYFVCAIKSTTGRSDEYVKSYKITMSTDSINFTPYKDKGITKVFITNQDGYSEVKKSLKNKPLMRYIRLYPIDYHDYKCIKLAIYGYAKFQVCISNPLGMQSGDIPNNRLSASSSQHSPSNARLVSGSSWCPTSQDSKPYLDVNLVSDHVICAVATQGNKAADKWVTSYRISLYSSGSSWTHYKENSSSVARVFYGNYDRSTIVRRVLYNSPTARYVRILPQTYHGKPCLRLEIYGHQLEPICSKHSVGVSSTLIVPDHRFTASSYYDSDYKPAFARLEGSESWMPRQSNSGYIQIDLVKMFRICAVLTQGDPGSGSQSYWVKKYKIQFSVDNISWTTYKEMGVDKVFQGNTDKSTIVTNSINKPFKAKFVRVVSTEEHNHIALRVDFKGTAEACTFPIGLENNEIPNSQMTSSSSESSHGASQGRLYGDSAWCSSTSSNTEYIQVDLGRVKTVTGIATQGYTSGYKWVTSYNLSYRFGSGVWYEFKEGQVTKLFSGNINRNGIVVNWLRRPIAARYVRILPQTSRSGHCMRFDLYGCDFAASPKATIPTNAITVPSTKGSSKTLRCTVAGEPTPSLQWFLNDTIMIKGATQATITVPFNSAKNIISTYSCKRQDPNTRPVICKMNYTCRAMFPTDVPSAGTAEDFAEATVNLNVPAKQVFSVTPGKRSLRITWAPVKSDDVGDITSFTIKLNNQAYHALSYYTWYSFPNLKPYTNYTIQMKAISVVGDGLWSSVKTATFIAEPEVSPQWVSAIVKSSTSMRITWTFGSYDKLNGPMAGFRITYTDAVGIRGTKQVGDIRSALLTQLKKYMAYSISVSVWNSLFYGPESSSVTNRTSEDVPAIAPQGITVTKQNETMFTIAWQPLPRNKANGVITNYKVTWILMQIGHAKRKAVGESFTGTTQGTNYVLHGLRVCAQYEVRVAAVTAAGAGPNGTHNITTSQPHEPHSLRSSEVGKTFMRVKWKKPKETSEDVKTYKIYLKGSKPTYWPAYSTPVKVERRDGSQTTHEFNNLQPGTHYEFWVIASTVCGESNKSLTAIAETNVDKPQRPQGTPISLKNSLNVTLWTVKPYNGPISSYQVIIINGDKNSTDELPEILNNYKQAKQNDQDFYITAELTLDEFSTVLVIGDNKMYGIYKNVALEKGRVYTVAERAITRYKGKSYRSKAAHIATIKLSAEPSKNAKSESGSSSTGVVIGVVLPLLLIVVILALLVFKCNRNRDTNKEERPAMPLDDVKNYPDGSANEIPCYEQVADDLVYDQPVGEPTVTFPHALVSSLSYEVPLEKDPKASNSPAGHYQELNLVQTQARGYQSLQGVRSAAANVSPPEISNVYESLRKQNESKYKELVRH